ncbi:AraC family transcriptional regulator [Leucobacter japonicus]|uniref:AraC family transcriptional regulator n=1 Tax=Leucobacter japonicus TaxID=1461259 RepID=UPI0006A7F11A|nr:AraC family transcriptional regulator [Leucobacter japonicus]
MADPDRLAPLLERLRISTSLFFTGAMCGREHFAAHPGRGFLHVLRRGELTMEYLAPDGSARSLSVDRPSVVFVPRPWEHTFVNAPVGGSDFTCAALDVSGGATHPLFAALPHVVVIPLDDIAELEPALQLLFGEADQVRCGRTIIADRLFEVVLIQLLRWMLDHADALQISAGLVTGLGDPRLAPLLTELHAEPGRAWTIEQMARTAMMSRSVFMARFTSVMGIAPAEYLTRWRLTLAQGRLLAGESVTRVAAELGYASASSFTRAFTQHLGASPRHWAQARDGAGGPAPRG